MKLNRTLLIGKFGTQTFSNLEKKLIYNTGDTVEKAFTDFLYFYFNTKKTEINNRVNIIKDKLNYEKSLSKIEKEDYNNELETCLLDIEHCSKMIYIVKSGNISDDLQILGFEELMSNKY